MSTNKGEPVLAPPFLIILPFHQLSRIKALPDFQPFLTAIYSLASFENLSREITVSYLVF